MIKAFYKHIPFKGKFTHAGIEYIKTSFNRGYYYKDGKQVFRNFKKKTIVFTDEKCFDIPLNGGE